MIMITYESFVGYHVEKRCRILKDRDRAKVCACVSRLHELLQSAGTVTESARMGRMRGNWLACCAGVRGAAAIASHYTVREVDLTILTRLVSCDRLV